MIGLGMLKIFESFDQWKKWWSNRKEKGKNMAGDDLIEKRVRKQKILRKKG